MQLDVFVGVASFFYAPCETCDAFGDNSSRPISISETVSLLSWWSSTLISCC